MNLRNFTLFLFLFLFSYASAQDFILRTSDVKPGFRFQLQTYQNNTTVQIDWGDGGGLTAPAPVTGSGDYFEAPASLSGSKVIKIYSSDKVEEFGFSRSAANSLLQLDDFVVNSATSGLKRLKINECNLQTVDVSKALLLEEFTCTVGDLTSVDLSHNLVLARISVNGNLSLSSLTLSNNSSLTDVSLSNTILGNNGLQHILSSSPNLIKLNINSADVSTKISAVDFSSNIKLQDISIVNNLLTGSIDLSGLNELARLNFSTNKEITSVSITSPVLTYINLLSNKVTSLNLTGFPDLETLYCGDNQLNTLDLSVNVKLTDLKVQKNNLESIALNPSVSLTSLNVSDNKLNFSTLPRVSIADYVYSSQRDSITIEVGGDNWNVVDLGSILTAISDGPVPGTLGQKSTFVWYASANGVISSLTPVTLYYTQAGDIFTFQMDKLASVKKTDFVLAEIKNKAYPNVSIYTKVVQLTQPTPVGVNPSEEDSNVVYYNSSSDELIYNVAGACHLSIANLLGQVVDHRVLSSDNGSVVLSDFVDGIYFVQIKTSTGKFLSKKVLKK